MLIINVSCVQEASSDLHAAVHTDAQTGSNLQFVHGLLYSASSQTLTDLADRRPHRRRHTDNPIAISSSLLNVRSRVITACQMTLTALKPKQD